MIASKTVKADTFKLFVEDTYKNYASDAKMIVNSFIGDMGKKWDKKDYANITNSHEMLLSMITIQESRGYSVTFD